MNYKFPNQPYYRGAADQVFFLGRPLGRFGLSSAGECLDRTEVQGDFSLLGSEFINFISTVLTCRMLLISVNAKSV